MLITKAIEEDKILLKSQTQSFRIEANSSPVQISFIFIIHILAVCSCLISTLPMTIKMVLLVGILLYLIYTLYLIANLTGFQLQYTSSRAWEAAFNGVFSPIHILPSTVITPLVIFLHFKKQSGKKQSMLIFNDAISPEAFRKLTVELRINSLN